jgi:hypothetical protein
MIAFGIRRAQETVFLFDGSILSIAHLMRYILSWLRLSVAAIVVQTFLCSVGNNPTT